jgi:hypothetical protein
MAQKKRTRLRRSFVEFSALAGTGYLSLIEAWWGLAFFWLTVALTWIAFCKRTVCDVEKRSNGEPCENIAYGKLLSCHEPSHKRAKVDALFALFGLENPGRRFRIMWARSRTEHGRRSPLPHEREPQPVRPMYEFSMLFATVGSFIVALVAFLVKG